MAASRLARQPSVRRVASALALAAALSAAGVARASPPETAGAPPPNDNAETGGGAGFPEAGSGGPESTGGRYRYARWAEDWTFLRDPARRDGDLFEPLKYVPLSADGEAYVTFSGDARLGTFDLAHAALKAGAPATDTGVFRASLGADIHFNPSFRVYGELGTAEIGGQRFTNLIMAYRSALYLRQGFAAYDGRLFGGDAGVMLGRFQHTDGPQQVLSTRDIPNLQFVFDGARAFVTWPRARADLIDLYGLTYRNGVLDSDTNPHQRLYGLNTSFVLSEHGAKGLFFDPFYFGYDDAARRLGPRVGREALDTYGARLWGQAGPAKIDWVGERQTGSFEGRPIDAFAAYAKGDLGIGAAPGTPRIGFRADAASGGGAFGAGKLHNADYLYGSAPYLSYGLLLSGQNLVDAAPTAEITLPEHVKLAAEYVWLWRYDPHDAVYNVFKVAYAGTQNATSRFTGELLRLKVSWRATPHVELDAELERFDPGSAVQRVGLGDTVFGSTYLQLRF